MEFVCQVFFETCHCCCDFLAAGEHFIAACRVLPADKPTAPGGVEIRELK
jgi:hypothetical protein